MTDRLPPAGVWLSAGFFALAGLLEVVLALVEAPRPTRFWPLWEALGRGLLHGLVAWGLWERIALCRTVAMIYCLAAIVTYLVAIGLALGGAPLQFPSSLVVQSLYQVPSCALLLPYLRSPRAAALFVRPLLPR
jgi:hypothetical protein